MGPCATERDGALSVSAGKDGEITSPDGAKQVRVDIAGGLLRQGYRSGSRSVFQHRRGPLSICRHLVSADPVDLARRTRSGKPVGTHPEQRAPVWLTGDAAKKPGRRCIRAHDWRWQGSGCRGRVDSLGLRLFCQVTRDEGRRRDNTQAGRSLRRSVHHSRA